MRHSAALSVPCLPVTDEQIEYKEVSPASDNRARRGESAHHTLREQARCLVSDGIVLVAHLEATGQPAGRDEAAAVTIHLLVVAERRATTNDAAHGIEVGVHHDLAGAVPGYVAAAATRSTAAAHHRDARTHAGIGGMFGTGAVRAMSRRTVDWPLGRAPVCATRLVHCVAQTHAGIMPLTHTSRNSTPYRPSRALSTKKAKTIMAVRRR